MRALEHTRRTALLSALSLLALAGLAGCGGSESHQANSSTAGAVAIKDFSFGPAHLTVTTGTTVDFTNHDSTAHTATAKGGSAFDTGTIAPGKTASIELKKPGTYSYYCAFHPFMKGTITVDSP